MFIRLIVILAIFSVAAFAAVQSNKKTEALFEKFIHDYDRHYLSAGEREQRYQNFLVALDRVLEKNSRYGAQYGINKFSDWSEDELAARKMPPISPEDFVQSCLAPNVTKAAPMKESDLAAPPPASFDWRTKGVVTPVKNQGQCGSCWTFSTTGNIESQYAISGKPLTGLSEQMIVDCSHACVEEDGQQVCNQGCNGGWMWTAMTDIVSWGGLETESAYPYVGETETCSYDNKTATLYAPLANYTCIGTDENEILLQLLARGPLSIAMNADLLEDYTSGVIDPSAWFDDDDGCDPSSLDHAILIVGYGVEDGWVEDTPYWIIKNSWGADWGESGYFRIIRGDGACGINEAVTCAELASTD